MALRSVSALVLDGLAIFEFGVICEVFGIDRSADGVPNFDFKVCGPAPGMSLRTSVGATITPDHGLDELIGADLVAIPAISSQYGGYLPAALDAVRKAAESGSIILTVCSGAFLAGAAGLLDGRPCTTHWMHADELAQMYPTAKVDRNVLFVARSACRSSPAGCPLDVSFATYTVSLGPSIRCNAAVSPLLGLVGIPVSVCAASAPSRLPVHTSCEGTLSATKSCASATPPFARSTSAPPGSLSPVRYR